jgi:hypothetical protein
MQTAMQLLFIGICLWFIYAAIRYSGPAQIQILGVFASDGTRLDRPMHQAHCPAPVAIPLSMTVSGAAQLRFSKAGHVVVTGPGRVTIRR